MSCEKIAPYWLRVAAILLTMLGIGFPLMNYQFVQKEHVQELRKQIDEAKEDRPKIESMLLSASKQLQENQEKIDAQNCAYQKKARQLQGDDEGGGNG
ncbi:MAG: hypothetical protein LBC83_01795 [Oscillospiraceae bacterium]|nr:hypothetical protein [Oscillospiraceae bacterium]